jgi:3-oxoadipate enol-lactonase
MEKSLNSQWIEINGVLLRYAHTKSEASLPRGTLVMIHEMGGALEIFDDIVPELSKRWDILRYDQRGAGLSEKTRGALDVDVLTDDLTQLLQALQIEGPVAVMACALGCAVAVRFAARHPENLRSLILMSPATASAPDRRDWVRQYADSVERDGMRATVLNNEPGHALDLHDILRMVSDPGSVASYWRMALSLDLDASLAAIRCPTLVLAGKRDKIRHPARVEAEVVTKIPGVTYKAIDSGHVMPVDTPELVVELLTSFFSEHRV